MARVQERFRERGRRKVGRKRKRRRKLNSSVNMKLTGWKKERSASRVSLVLLPDSFPELRRKDIEENSDRTGKCRNGAFEKRRGRVVRSIFVQFFKSAHMLDTEISRRANRDGARVVFIRRERTRRSGRVCSYTPVRKITTPSFPRDRGKYKFSRFVLFKLVRPPQTSGSNTG